MDVQRIWVLMGKEIRLGLTSFMSIYVLVAPVVLSLLVALIFGDLFAQTPRLGIFDAGGNETLVQALASHPSIKTRSYASQAALEAAVGRGSVEVGMSLEAGFTDALRAGDAVARINTYRWGEAGARSLTLIESALARVMVDATGLVFDELPVSVEVVQLGKASTATWSQRLLPLLLIMAIVLSGLFIPSSSLVDEKQKGTLVALTTTPASLLDVYLAKTAVGFLLSGLMALIILALNNAFAGNPGLLLLVIALGGLMSSILGVILGSWSRDMETFMGIIKVLGLVLYAPGILEIFPQVPQWIGRVFPTYYIMNPLLEISRNAARFADIVLDLAILLGFIVILAFVLAREIQRQQQQLALEG